MGKRKQAQGGELVAFEAFFHSDQSAVCWLVARLGPNGMRRFEVRFTTDSDKVNTALERTATGLYDDVTDIALYTHPQTFTVEAAALKMMKRLIQERIGGIDGWEQVYNGDLCLESLEGRETVSPFGAVAPEISDNPTAESVGAFSGSDDDFAARRRAKKARKRKQQQDVLEATALDEDGKTKIRAFHSSDDLRNVGHSVALVEVWAVPQQPNPLPPVPDSLVGTGRILNNNNMYATIVANMRSDSETLSKTLMWYYGKEAPIFIGRSEPYEHGGSK